MPDSYTVQTVHGARRFNPSGGLVLPHEHILCDSRVWWEGKGDWREFDDPAVVAGTSWSELARLPQALTRENMLLSDWYLGAQELRLARESGAQLVVDLTVLGSGPNAEISVRAADLAGIGLVTSVGRYLHDTLPESERSLPAEGLVDRWVGQISEGVQGFLPGIIGEIGTSETITSAEVNSLKAAARTQQLTGLPVNVHVHPYARRALDAIAILDQEGADLSRVGISHLDCDLDIEQLVRILHTGVYIEMDNFGTGRQRLVLDSGYPDDSERLDAIEELCSRGYDDRLLLSHDINHRNSLASNGGWGYRHIGTEIFPQLVERLGAELARQLVADNPLSYLSVRTPTKA